MIYAAPFVLFVFGLMLLASLFMMGGDTEGDFDLKKQWQIHKQHKAYKRQQDEVWKRQQAAMEKRNEAKKSAKT
ncbi:hypothetical protein [Microvirga sp. P5_D2]